MVTPVKGVAAEEEARAFRFSTVALHCVALLLPTGVLAGAAESDRVVSFDIPRQRADQALIAFAEQADVTFIFPADEARKVTANAVHGELTPHVAIGRLLEGTGLQPRIQADGELTVNADHSSAEKGDTVKKRGLVASIIAALTAGAAVDVKADQAAESASDPVELGEVMVTAQKREERLEDVPISVTVLNEQNLARLGAKDINDFYRSVPNLALQPNVVGASTVAIRGITSSAGSPTVGVYIDETPVQVYQRGFTGNANPKVFDLDRIEVLRGPQGTLYGSSSMGGMIRYVSKQPSLTDFSARVVTEAATTDGGDPSWEVGAAGGGPIVENKVGYRASIYYRADGGYIDKHDRATGDIERSNINDETTLAVRGALTTKIGETFDATLSEFYQEIERDDSPVYERPTGPFTQGFQIEQPGRDRFSLPSLKVSGTLGSVTLTSITALFRREDREDADYSSLVTEFVLVPALGADWIGVEGEGGSVSQATNEQRNFSQELRFASDDPSARYRWVVGGYYQTSELEFDQVLVEHGLEELIQSAFGAGVEAIFGMPLLPGDVSFVGHQRTKEEQLAGFGEINFKLSPHVELFAGLRVSKNEITTQEVADGILNGGPTPPDVAAAKHQDESPLTPRVGVNFTPNEDNLIYASYSEGFRSGAGNPPVPTGPCETDLAALGLTEAPSAYSSDETQNYEVGYKGTLADRRLSISAAVFQIDWTDIQQSVYLPTCGFSFVGNLGEARSRGFELELQSQLTHGWFLSGALGYTDAEFTKTISLGSASTLVSDGDRVPFTPEWTATAEVEKRFQLADMPAYLRADYQYRAGVNSTVKEEDVAANPFLFKQDSYDFVSARAGIAISNWDVAVYVENLLDDDPVLMRANSLNPVTNLHVREISLRPRTIGLTISRSF